MDMKVCPSLIVSSFYRLEYKGHEMCCNQNHERDTDKILSLREALKYVHREDEIDCAGGAYRLPDNCSKLENALFDSSTGLLKNSIDMILDLADVSVIRKLFLGTSAKDLLIWGEELSGSMCHECFFFKEDCACEREVGKVAGALIAEFLLLMKLEVKALYRFHFTLLMERQAVAFLHKVLGTLAPFSYEFNIMDNKCRLNIVSHIWTLLITTLL
ncbi:hypothetical protein KAFR_0B07050 [Kazachstania africana CBS 2517]|uniref:Uncharacterized protein n=1 Tax=Kazachstania africana (strain ATCC 22294 / BCRC 22015 / CBS 2517 / CECT 1963 / NBRC 1671 / NRRL Y-8276) TaxID=1071382 RepID=H2ARK4_KAZAF|nr:hypothetical protein KAFR_0B07050 [Kazachstania africana CBS 2517]CCF57004.1 hypothetical protein KAFR_0B07050 [Kazachstania africana CBS 2517]